MKKMYVAVMVATWVMGTASASRADSVGDLQKQLDDLRGRVQELQKQKKADDQGDKDGYFKKVWGATRLSGYGELDYIFRRDNGNGKGGNTLDPHRVVLNVTSELSDWITFNSELEWEHGGSDGQDGGVAVEQAYLDFKVRPAVNVRAGVMLMPLGAINQNHEPVNFYSTARPALDTYIIPSTWQEMGIGLHGAPHKIVDYQIMAVTGLDGSKFDATSGLREGRPSFGQDSNRNFAVTGRLDVRPVAGLTTSVSFYAGNSAPSGAPTAYTTLLAFDGKYRYKDFEIAGEYAHVYQDKPGVLSPEIGRTMSGYWFEGAWHAMPESLKKGRLSNADAVLFARWSELNTQASGVADPAKVSGRFDRNYLTVGLSFLPIPSVAVKADYQIYNDHRSAGELPLDNDKFQLTLGFVF